MPKLISVFTDYMTLSVTREHALLCSAFKHLLL